ncbi:MAG: hypothetical protein J3K34DRAFT_411576 [Monoraphidium minutum]|nr:MAG: hypothetical protein J3K34DRAFT_411576 [Monoraphidium minutum]
MEHHEQRGIRPPAAYGAVVQHRARRDMLRVLLLPAALRVPEALQAQAAVALGHHQAPRPAHPGVVVSLAMAGQRHRHAREGDPHERGAGRGGDDVVPQDRHQPVPADGYHRLRAAPAAALCRVQAQPHHAGHAREQVHAQPAHAAHHRGDAGPLQPLLDPLCAGGAVQRLRHVHPLLALPAVRHHPAQLPHARGRPQLLDGADSPGGRQGHH